MQLPTESLFLTLAVLCGAAAQAETPKVEWVRQIGTGGHDQSNSVAVDAEGNTYITGLTYGSLGGANAGSYDAFLTKFDSRGSELWTQQIGTNSDDVSSSVAVDFAGNAYVSGRTSGSLGGANAGGVDAFLAKFDRDGNGLWTQQIGTSSDDSSYSVAVDAAGNAYISGDTVGSLGGASSGGPDVFLAKFDSNGNNLWAGQIGTTGSDQSFSMEVDASGNSYISGVTNGRLGSTDAGGTDAFMAKFDSSGSELWIKQIGTGDWDASWSATVDAAGNAYVGGVTLGSLAGTNVGGLDAFLIKLDGSGNELWTKQFGTSGDDRSYSMAVDASGNAYVSGATSGSLGSINAGGLDAFLVKFDSDGSVRWTEQIGTTSDDLGWSVAVDAAGNAYLTGRTSGRLVGANSGSSDAFLVKYRIVPEPGAAVLAAFAGTALLAMRRRMYFHEAVAAEDSRGSS